MLSQVIAVNSQESSSKKDETTSNLVSPPGNLPGGEQPQIIYEARRKQKRERMVQAALEENHSLSPTVQENLLKHHLAEGWGKLAHGITRQLKAPGRNGLKLVDVALIMTVYDRTIAQVNPTAFAPISGEDFRSETGMDESNIRMALNALVRKGILLKNKTGLINFWAINPYYFSSKEIGQITPGNLPVGSSHSGNAPAVKQGKLPGESKGQFARGQSDESSEKHSEISDAKNLSQESKKESSLCTGDFPDDLKNRWANFEKSGLGQKAKTEREIFQKLFLIHGRRFSENCANVIQYLETHGTGKSGDEGRIHSPMVWIQNHWELNLTRYQNWKTKEQSLNETYAKELEKEARAKAELAQREKTRSQEALEEAEWKKRLESDIERILSAYSSEERLKAFIEEAIQFGGNDYIRSSWLKSGWNSPIVKSCVVSHFRRLDEGERLASTTVMDSTEENQSFDSEEIA